jgi:hypothetical protein
MIKEIGGACCGEPPSKSTSAAAFTGDLARDLDGSQYEAGHRPCLQASAAATTMSVPEEALPATTAGR